MSVLSHADLANLCSRAYTELSGVSRELEFLIRRVDNVSYIAIRGTEASGFIDGFGWLDVIRNMRVLPRYNKATGAGHGGFITGGESVARALIEFGALGDTVVITGHSLGAAVGIVAAQILHEAGFKIDEVVLFGCPRVYALIRPKFNFPVTSYRHGSDVVCNVPRCYRQPVGLTKLNPNSNFPNWGDHMIEKYELALRALESAA
jgi:hypothetical protein